MDNVNNYYLSVNYGFFDFFNQSETARLRYLAYRVFAKYSEVSEESEEHFSHGIVIWGWSRRVIERRERLNSF